jgi:hypothetical protein
MSGEWSAAPWNQNWKRLWATIQEQGLSEIHKRLFGGKRKKKQVADYGTDKRRVLVSIQESSRETRLVNAAIPFSAYHTESACYPAQGILRL